MSVSYIVAVHLSTTGGGKRWYRSIPRSHTEAMAEHAQYTREGFDSRVELAPKSACDAGRRVSRLRRAKQRTRQLTLFEGQ